MIAVPNATAGAAQKSRPRVDAGTFVPHGFASQKLYEPLPLYDRTSHR